MDCIICERKFEKNILFENDQIIVMLAVEPSVNGHIQIFSKNHHTIMEQATDDEISQMMAAANKISMILFEALKVHGTNIIINNGVPAGQKIPHFAIDILPRRNDDNLKLDWALKQATPEALDSIHKIIEEGLNTPSNEIIEEATDTTEAKSETELTSRTETKKRSDEDKDKNYDYPEEKQEKKTNFYHQLFERIP
jgi:diadenosine tetraphosphate (Ap4A) HIT family hydrolase